MLDFYLKYTTEHCKHTNKYRELLHRVELLVHLNQHYFLQLYQSIMLKQIMIIICVILKLLKLWSILQKAMIYGLQIPTYLFVYYNIYIRRIQSTAHGLHVALDS